MQSKMNKNVKKTVINCQQRSTLVNSGQYGTIQSKTVKKNTKKRRRKKSNMVKDSQ